MPDPHDTRIASARQVLKKLTKLQKQFLARRVCAWCEHRLDWPGCGAIYEKCTPRQQVARRRRALKTYRPRRSRAQEVE